MSTLSSLVFFDTELSAVNSILGSIGQAPLSSLEFENPETAFVYQIFTDTVIDVLAEGWSFNSHYNLELVPDDDKHVSIPANFLRVDSFNNQRDRTLDLIVNEGRLWDKLAQTDEFDESIYVDYVYGTEWSDIPVVFRRYIVARASVRAATQLVTNKELVTLLASQESYLRASCMEYECNQGTYSYLGNGPGTMYQSYQPFNALNRY